MDINITLNYYNYQLYKTYIMLQDLVNLKTNKNRLSDYKTVDRNQAFNISSSVKAAISNHRLEINACAVSLIFSEH